jgi:hypothetical protein
MVTKTFSFSLFLVRLRCLTFFPSISCFSSSENYSILTSAATKLTAIGFWVSPPRN